MCELFIKIIFFLMFICLICALILIIKEIIIMIFFD